MRHRQLVLAAGFRQGVHHIVRVLLGRIVHARLRGGPAPVIVDAKTATDVHVRNIDAQAPQLRVVARGFLQASLDVANVGDLRAEVKMNELEDIEPIERLQLVDELDELRCAQTELRLLAAALRPAPRTFRIELDSNSGRRLDSQLVSDLQEHIDFAQLLEDYEYL